MRSTILKGITLFTCAVLAVGATQCSSTGSTGSAPNDGTATSAQGSGGASLGTSISSTQSVSLASTGGPGTSGQTTSGAGAGGGGGSSGFIPYACPAGSFAGIAIPNGSTATPIAGAPPQDAFNDTGKASTNVEGPVWIGDALYFSEISGAPNPPPSRILRIDENDGVTIAFPSIPDTGSNGLAVDAKGDIVSANHGIGGILVFSLPDGTKTTLVDTYNGARFNSPNDLTIRSDGTIYFTDPGFQAPTPLPQSGTWVYRVPPGGMAIPVVQNVSNPNGITLSLDEKTIYVGNAAGVYAYSVNGDGTLGAVATHVDPADFDKNATDGMAIDCAGNLYIVRVAQHDIVVVDASGNKVGQIVIPGAGALTNCAFGGADHKTLYVTSGGKGTERGVFKLAMPLPGMPY